jgi:hypothetical protein
MGWPFSKKQTEHEKPARGVRGATIRVRAESDRFRSRTYSEKEAEQHAFFGELYDTSIAGSIINTETDDIFAQGWALQGEKPEDVARVREYLTAVHFETEVRKMTIESKVHGFGFAEIGTIGSRHVLVAHSTLNIVPQMDDDGWLDALVQLGRNGKILASWGPAEGITLALRPSASVPGLGRSELAQAAESIIDYENVRKANMAMVERMGFPTYDIEFTDDQGIVSADVLEGELGDVGPGSVFSGIGRKINTLNASGVPQVQTYAETALQAVAAAMQVPRAMVGLADNSEATAKVTLSKYYNRIAAEQQIIAQTMQEKYLDIWVLPDLGIPKGSVQIIFNNPDPDAQLKKAQLLQIITALDPTDPEYLLSVEEQAEIWGKHPKKGEYDADKFQDMLMQRVARHIADIQGAPASEDQPQEGTE